MKWTRILPEILACFALVLFPWLGYSEDLPLNKLETEIPRALADFQVPGLAIGIVKDGIPVYAKGFGVKNINGKDPLEENTIFGLGSASKTFKAGLAAPDNHWEAALSIMDPLPENGRE